MAMTKRNDRPPPSGAWIVWMAGLVMGAGAGMLFIYHMLLASHAVTTQPLPPVRAAIAPVAVTTTAVKGQFNAEHAAALREATKPAKG